MASRKRLRASAERNLGDRGAVDAAVPTLEDVLAACAPPILEALGDTHWGVRGAIFLAQTGALGRAPDANATLQEHWRSLVRPPHSAQFVTNAMNLQQLRQAAKDAGVAVSGTKPALLARLPRNCPPILFSSVRESASTSRLEVALALAATAANPAWSRRTHITATNCRAAPYRLPDVVLDAMVHHDRTGRWTLYQRWYPKDAAIAVALALHGPGDISAEDRRALEQMQEDERNAAAAAEQAAQLAAQRAAEAKARLEEAKRVRKAAEAQRLEDVAAAFAAAGLPRPPASHTGMSRRGMTVTANHVFAEDRRSAPSLSNALAAAKDAAWYTQHIPATVSDRFALDIGHEYPPGDAQRRKRAVLAAVAQGPAVAEVDGCPAEVVRASGRIHALEAALEALGVECRPPWMALLNHNPLNKSPLQGSPVTWAYACEISPVPVLATAAAAVEQAAWFMAQGMESYHEAQSVSAPPAEMKRATKDLVQRLGAEAAAAMPGAPRFVLEAASIAAAPAFLAQHGPVEGRRLALLGPQENGPLALRTQASCNQLSRVAKAVIDRASAAAAAALQAATARREVADLMSGNPRLGMAPAVLAAALGGLPPLEASLLVTAASQPQLQKQLHKQQLNGDAKTLCCPFPGCKAGARLFSKGGLKDHWGAKHGGTPPPAYCSVTKPSNTPAAALTQRLPKGLSKFAVALAARQPKPELSAACAEWAAVALASATSPAPADAPAAAPAPA